jgi:hypothetical protein
MSFNAIKTPATASNGIIEQLSAMPATGRSEVEAVADLKSKETHTSTTIIERIVNARRGYLAWLAVHSAAITGKEPPIDGDADASWRAR